MNSMERMISDEMKKIPEGVDITNVHLNVAEGRGNVEFKDGECTYQVELRSSGVASIVGEKKEDGVFIRYYGIRNMRPYQFLLRIKETIEEIVTDSQMGMALIRREHFDKDMYSITYSDFENLVIFKGKNGETKIKEIGDE